jgi:hypothetical protein
LFKTKEWISDHKPTEWDLALLECDSADKWRQSGVEVSRKRPGGHSPTFNGSKQKGKHKHVRPHTKNQELKELRRKKRIAKFDSTLGYPGEGPSNISLKNHDGSTVKQHPAEVLPVFTEECKEDLDEDLMDDIPQNLNKADKTEEPQKKKGPTKGPILTASKSITEKFGKAVITKGPTGVPNANGAPKTTGNSASICRKCRSKGHKAADCKNNKVAKKQPKAVQQQAKLHAGLKGKTVAEALAETTVEEAPTEANDPNAPDVPKRKCYAYASTGKCKFGEKCKFAHLLEEEEKQEECQAQLSIGQTYGKPETTTASDPSKPPPLTDKEKYDILVNNLRDKIRHKLLLIDVDSPIDKRVTYMSALNILRKDTMYKLRPDVDGAALVEKIYTEELQSILDTRLKYATKRTQIGQKFKYGFSFEGLVKQTQSKMLNLKAEVDVEESIGVGAKRNNAPALLIQACLCVGESLVIRKAAGFISHHLRKLWPRRHLMVSMDTMRRAAKNSQKDWFHEEKACLRSYNPFLASEKPAEPTYFQRLRRGAIKHREVILLASSFMLAGLAFSLVEKTLRRKKNSILWTTMVHSANGFFPGITGLIKHSTLHLANNFTALYCGRPDLTACVINDICLGERNFKEVKVQDGFEMDQHSSECTEKFACFRHWGVAGWVPTIYRQCHENEVVSLRGRVGKHLPQHDPGQAKEVSKEWSKLTSAVLHHFTKIKRVTSGMPFEEWIQPFPPAKRQLFQNLLAKPEDDWSSSASSFIKREKATHPGVVVNGIFVQLALIIWKDPRMIQGCPPELSLSTGPHVRKLAKNFSRKFAPTHYTLAELRSGKHIVYTCGMTAEDVGEALGKAIKLIEASMEPDDEVAFLEDDQSRFDEHMTKGSFRFLGHVYRKTLVKRVQKALKRGRSSGCTALGTKYSVDYTMQSGWPDTSLGDTLVNSGMKMYIHGPGRLWISIICGDDSITVTTRKEIQRIGGSVGLIASYAKLGMEVEVKVSDDIMDVEFCSGVFRPSNSTYVLFPKVGRFLAKIAHDTTQRNHAGSMSWLRGIAATCASFGELDPLCKALSIGLYKEVGTVGKAIYTPLNPYKSWPVGTNIPTMADVLLFYSHRYGFSSYDLECAAETLMGIKLGTDSDCPLLQRICEIDL